MQKIIANVVFYILFIVLLTKLMFLYGLFEYKLLYLYNNRYFKSLIYIYIYIY